MRWLQFGWALLACTRAGSAADGTASVDGSTSESAEFEAGGDGCTARLSFDFEIDSLGEAEAYVCSSFDAQELEGRFVTAVHWHVAEGGTMLHHAALRVTSLEPEPQPTVCEAIPPDAVTVHLWAPGTDALELPRGVGLVLPKQRHTLTIESHALRLGSGQAARGTVEVCLTEQPEVTAAWLGLQAPVPAIRPHQRESAAAECEFGARWQLFSAWPHMHRSGKRFEVDHLRAGQRESLLVVEPWDFQRQATYLLTQGLEPGDRIALKCVWENQGDEYVLPGPNTEDEMCSLGLIGFPASAAHCEYRE